MLATKRSAVVAPELNLRESITCTRQCIQARDLLIFCNLGKTSPKSKTLLQRTLMSSRSKKVQNKKCILVGCIPPTYLPACTAGRGSALLGGLVARGEEGVCLVRGGLLARRVFQHALRQTPPCEQNHRHL